MLRLSVIDRFADELIAPDDASPFSAPHAPEPRAGPDVDAPDACGHPSGYARRPPEEPIRGRAVGFCL